MRTSRQSGEQLGLHGDNKHHMELEVMGSIVNSGRAETCRTTSSRKEATTDYGVQDVSFCLHSRSMPDHTSRTSDDSPVTKLDGLHTILLSLVWNNESVTSSATTEAYWQKELRRRESEANRNRNATPRWQPKT